MPKHVHSQKTNSANPLTQRQRPGAHRKQKLKKASKSNCQITTKKKKKVRLPNEKLPPSPMKRSQRVGNFIKLLNFLSWFTQRCHVYALDCNAKQTEDSRGRPEGVVESQKTKVCFILAWIYPVQLSRRILNLANSRRLHKGTERCLQVGPACHL